LGFLEKKREKSPNWTPPPFGPLLIQTSFEKLKACKHAKLNSLTPSSGARRLLLVMAIKLQAPPTIVPPSSHPYLTSFVATIVFMLEDVSHTPKQHLGTPLPTTKREREGKK